MHAYHLLYLVVFSVAGCRMGDPRATAISPLPIAEPVRIEVGPRALRQEHNRYFSRSYTRETVGGEVVREREDAVDFLVESTGKDYNAESGRLTLEIAVVKKDGQVNLRELAFPELGEKIEAVYSRDAEVLKYGLYPDWSVFFVPSVPVPTEPVAVGDSWDFLWGWRDLENGFPLRLEMAFILKGIYPCGASRCADLEGSGYLRLVGMQTDKARYSSERWSRILVQMDTGAVVRSYTKGTEHLVIGDKVSDTVSCMVSSLEKPESEAWPVAFSPSCDPKADLPEVLPGTVPQ